MIGLSYTAYGLGIRSFLPLPELEAADGAIDMIVRRASVEDSLAPVALFPVVDEDDELRPYLRSSSEEIQLLWPDVGRAKVVDGREIVVHSNPGIPDPLLRLHILGSALGVALIQRGLFPLHASGVIAAGGAIAFAGEWGMGKSTTAAAMVALGFDLLADDIVAIDLLPSLPAVRVGVPQLKLWPESIAAVGERVDGMPRVHPDLEKRSKRVQSQPHGSGLPLRCIYVLEHGLSLGIEPVAANDALLDIICHWYGARFGTDFLTPNERVGHFQNCVRLADEVPVYRLIRPDNLELLPELAQLVAAHVPEVMRFP